MQADLRRAHRRIWPALGVVLVLGFALALLLRPERPVETAPLPERHQS